MLKQHELIKLRCIRHAHVGIAAVVLTVLAACGSNSDENTSAAGSSSTSAPTSTEATGTEAPATAPTVPSDSTSAPNTGVSLIGLGDSIPGGANCTTPCRSYVEALSDLAAATLGQPVTATNLATNDSLTSTELLRRVTSEGAYIDAITTAEAITVQIGFNDWQGACYWPGHDACVKAGAAQVRENLGPILDQISTLRGGAPTAVWVVGYYDNTLGDPNVRTYWTLTEEDEPAFRAFYTAALADFNDMLCDVAESHDAMCVDVFEAFNGPGRDNDPAALLGGDHLHPSQTGHELIATTIDAVGYGPLG